MTKHRSRDPRPDLNKVPKIRSVPIHELPEDHVLVALAHIAASSGGLAAEHRRVLFTPMMSKFAPVLTKLNRSARAIHQRGGAAAPEQIRQLVEIALIDLSELCTDGQRRSIRTYPLSTATDARRSSTAA
ncbi:hypothetical protein ACGFIU_19460 [Rhodococcus oryzae]|uniref:hypothetical protein n=1 Tax=Rhodococcus oryzae TaxID=2571143 RepID=UPI0037213EEA